MYKNKTICVVIPAFNEELLIKRTVTTLPAFVDRAVVVDDCSSDATVAVVRDLQTENETSPEDNRNCASPAVPSSSASGDCAADRFTPEKIQLIRHETNQGVGAAIVTGYKWARDHEYDVTVVMAGDAQMNPNDLPAVLDPVVDGVADYSKGNRLFTGEAWNRIPHVRYLGNSALSLMTKIASGYWHVADSQTGYTAINLRMLKLIDWDTTYKRYGCPNDYLVRLNVYDACVADVPVDPVYGIGEKSGIKLWKVIPKMSFLLVKLFLWRMKEKYVIRDFHPLVFFYLLGLALLICAVPLGVRLFWEWGRTGDVPPMTALASFFAIVTGLQCSLFSMCFDMENNKHLK